MSLIGSQPGRLAQPESQAAVAAPPNSKMPVGTEDANGEHLMFSLIVNQCAIRLPLLNSSSGD